MNLLMSAVNFLIPGIFKEIDKAIPDQTAAAQLKASIQSQMMQVDSAEFAAQVSVIDDEAKGESWLQRNWRPVTMMVFVFIVANNYIIAPYAQAIFDRSVSLPTPPDLWALIKIGLGGYVVGRSAEKCVTAWKAS